MNESERDLHLKHCHTSTAQFKKRTTHLDFLGKVYDLYQHVVKTCPFCNSTKPRPDRSRVSGLRAEEFGDLIFLDHGSTKIGDKTIGFLIVLDGATSNLTAYPFKSISPSEVISKLHDWMDARELVLFCFCRPLTSPVRLNISRNERAQAPSREVDFATYHSCRYHPSRTFSPRTCCPKACAQRRWRTGTRVQVRFSVFPQLVPFTRIAAQATPKGVLLDTDAIVPWDPAFPHHPVLTMKIHIVSLDVMLVSLGVRLEVFGNMYARISQ